MRMLTKCSYGTQMLSSRVHKMTQQIPKTPMVEQYLLERRLYRAELIAHEQSASFISDAQKFDINDKFNELFGIMSNSTMAIKR